MFIEIPQNFRALLYSVLSVQQNNLTWLVRELNDHDLVCPNIVPLPSTRWTSQLFGPDSLLPLS